MTVGVDVGKNGVFAAAYAWTLARDHVDRIGDTLKLSDGREVILFVLPEAASYEDMKDALHVAIRGLRDHKVGKSTFADMLRGPISLKDDDLTTKISGDGA